MSSIFKRFNISNVTQLAATQQKEQKRIRSDLQDAFPAMADHWDDLIPKKQEITKVHCTEGIDLICIQLEDGKSWQVLFFVVPDGEIVPHLKVLHMYPWMCPKHQVDIGGCKFVVSGAPVMARGMTTPGGRVAPGVKPGDVVGVYVEGKQHAVGVGVATQSSEKVLKENSGSAVDNCHHLGDGLWWLPVLSQEKLAGAAKKKKDDKDDKK